MTVVFPYIRNELSDLLQSFRFDITSLKASTQTFLNVACSLIALIQHVRRLKMSDHDLEKSARLFSKTGDGA